MRAVILAALVAAAPAWAQTAPKPACQGPEFRQFDFWIGHWDVYNPAGKLVGESRIELHGNGCFLLENWHGLAGADGKSLNSYDASDKQWHQYWVDNSGSRLPLQGGFADGQMRLSAPGQRITWTPNPDGSVRQHWEQTADGGKTWTTAFNGLYKKRKE